MIDDWTICVLGNRSLMYSETFYGVHLLRFQRASREER